MGNLEENLINYCIYKVTAGCRKRKEIAYYAILVREKEWYQYSALGLKDKGREQLQVLGRRQLYDKNHQQEL